MQGFSRFSRIIDNGTCWPKVCYVSVKFLSNCTFSRVCILRVHMRIATSSTIASGMCVVYVCACACTCACACVCIGEVLSTEND